MTTTEQATTIRDASHTDCSPARFVRSPLFLLVLLLVASATARSIWITNPDFPAADERYYVSAARHIASLPATGADHYAGAPSGLDPNAEHPPLGKAFIAASMRLFGDTPLGWRMPSLIFGTLAVAAMFWLVRSAGGGQWEALAASALMAADNMFVVYGRFATLDIFVVVFMMVGIGAYLRGRPVRAGIVVGLGACTKLLGFTALPMLLVVEALRRSRQNRQLEGDRGVEPGQAPPSTRRNLRPLGACVLAAGATYLVVLGGLDRAVTEFPDPVSHTKHMLVYAAEATVQIEAQLSGAIASGLAPTSQPWHWFTNHGEYPIHRERAAAPGQPGSERIKVEFEARTTPAIMWMALPAFVFMVYRVWASADDPSNLAFAWCIVMIAFFTTLVLRERVSYIYYAVTILPGAHLAIARLMSRPWIPGLAKVVYGLVVLAGFAVSFPFRTWGGQ